MWTIKKGNVLPLRQKPIWIDRRHRGIVCWLCQKNHGISGVTESVSTINVHLLGSWFHGPSLGIRSRRTKSVSRVLSFGRWRWFSHFVFPRSVPQFRFAPRAFDRIFWSFIFCKPWPLASIAVENFPFCFSVFHFVPLVQNKWRIFARNCA